LVNVTQNENFNINVTDDSNKTLLYNCNFSSGIKPEKIGSIYCSINEKAMLQNISLTLNFEIINLTERNIYIINNSSNTKFTNDNVKCPYFYFINDSSTSPSMNSTDKSMSFSMKIETSLRNQEIKVYDSNNKTKDKLELKLKPSTTSKYIYRFLYLSAETGFDSECKVPKNTNISSQINCTGFNITDTKSKSFVTESSDQIYIGKYKFDINSNTVKNPYEKNDDGGNNDNDNNKESSNSISTAGKVVLIIFIILVFVAIILALLYYFCFYRKQNRESQTGSSIKSENKTNPSIHSNVSQNNSVDQSNSSQRNNNSKSSRKRVVNPNQPTFDYD